MQQAASEATDQSLALLPIITILCGVAGLCITLRSLSINWMTRFAVGLASVALGVILLVRSRGMSFYFHFFTTHFNKNLQVRVERRSKRVESTMRSQLLMRMKTCVEGHVVDHHVAHKTDHICWLVRSRSDLASVSTLVKVSLKGIKSKTCEEKALTFLSLFSSFLFLYHKEKSLPRIW